MIILRGGGFEPLGRRLRRWGSIIVALDCGLGCLQCGT